MQLCLLSAVVGLVGGKEEKEQLFLHCPQHLLGTRQGTKRFLEMISSHHQSKPLGCRKCYPPVTGRCQDPEKKVSNLPEPLLKPKSAWSKALTVRTVQTAAGLLVAEHGVGVRMPGRHTLEGTPVLGRGELDQVASS